MTYYINPIWFYLMNVCDHLEHVSIAVGVSFAFVSALGIIAIICNKIDGDNNLVNLLTKYVKPSVIIAIIFILLACIIPSKETCEEMLIASVVTQENVDQAKDDVESVIDYVFDRIENSNSESE